MATSINKYVTKIKLSRAQVKREHLWDEAYDNLRLVHPELVTQYEEILSLGIESMATDSSVGGMSRTGLMKTPISQTDIKGRWLQMCQLLSWWLDDRDRDSHKSNQLQDLLRGHIRESEGSRPPCALAWVCVCYASQVLLHPPSKTEAVRPGLLHIIAKMNWYNCLPRLIINGDISEPLEGDRVVRNRVVDLYEEILSYLMNVSLPAGCQLHDWDSSLARLKAAEDNLSTFSGGSMVQQLGKYLTLAREKEKEKEKENCQPSLKSKEAMAIPSKIDAKLALLGRVDTASSVIEAQPENDLLLHDLCQWICSTEQYKAVINWNTKDIEESDFSKNIAGNTTSHALVVTCGSKVNKTALMEAIARHLSSEANLEHPDVSNGDSKAKPWALSYYSCGRDSRGINNSGSVLRSVIHSLLQRQPQLIFHLEEALFFTDRRRFDSPEDFLALSSVLFKMLDDKAFVRSYLVIDGIDECSSGHGGDSGDGLGDLIRLIGATANVSHKIKWLLSTDMESLADFELIREECFRCINLGDQTPELARIFRRNAISKVDQLAKQRGYPEQTQHEFSRIISERSQKNSSYAVIACAMLRKEESWYAVEALKEMPERLDELCEYERVNLSRLPRQDPEFCKSVVSTMAIVYCPILVSELGRLAELPPQVDPVAIIEKCSFLEVRAGVVKFVDPAARQDTWQQLHQDLIKFSEAHSLITRKALEFLSTHFEAAALGVSRLSHSQDESREKKLANAYGTLHWMMHLFNVKDIAKDAAMTNAVVSFMNNHFLRWLDAIISDGLHIDTVVLMKKLEAVLMEQAKEEKSELPRSKRSKEPKKRTFEQFGRKGGNRILSLVQDGVQIIHSHISGNSIFHTNPSSVIFYPEESAMKQDWVAKNKTWLILPPKTTQNWSDSSLILANRDIVQSIDFSPDGRLLASGFNDHLIRVYDAETGAGQLILESSELIAHYVAFSPSGHLASVSENGFVSLWDLSTGRSFKTSQVQRRQVTSIRFSLNGEESEKLVLATSEALLLWSFSDFGKQTCTFTEKILEEEGSVNAVDFSQQGTWIASGSKRGDIKVWDAHRGNVLRRTLQGHKGDVCSLAFSRDEKHLVSGSHDLTVKFWSITTGTNLKSFDCGHVIYGVVFSPDDSLIAAGCNNQVRVWESETGAQKFVMKGHKKLVRTVAFSPQGRLASGSSDMTIRLWGSEGSASNGMNSLDEPSSQGPLTFITMSPDGKYLASASGETIYLWDGMTGKLMKQHKLSQGMVMSISFSPDGKRLVSSSRDEIVRVWDVTNGSIYRTYEGHTDWVTLAIFSHDGMFVVSASHDRTMRIWNYLKEGDGEDAKVISCDNGCVNAAAFSPDGKLLVTGEGRGHMTIWDSKSLRPERQVTEHSSRIMKVFFSQDSSRIVSCSEDSKVWVWDSTTGALIQGPFKTSIPQHEVGFDPKIPEYILTEFGFSSSSLGSSSFFTQHSLQSKRYGISKDGGWITWNGKNIIPIPAMYRPTASWVQGNIVAIRTKSGKVLLFRFSAEVEPPS